MVNHNVDILELENRRYIGSKTKLCDWIMSVISKETENVTSFCDLFAGTGVVSKQALKLFNEVIINDFLPSNKVIYDAFFKEGDYDLKKIYEIIENYNIIESKSLEDNWFSLNYGDKYFDNDSAKKIGFIRQDIEDNKDNLTEKEYNILLSSLIYSIDSIANTVGHYEAYFKKGIQRKELIIKPINAGSFENVRIYCEDANKLVREIESDLMYLDPPYNSRQYSRFYHVYETLVKWDKPKLYGVAMKPKADHMSEYCRSDALATFKDLVDHINANYIVVSYNNTYNSKSNSSENKIRLEDLEDCLRTKGETKVFSKKYNAFNAGKTDMDDHKELLFLTKIEHDR